ncbi:MAG TPA: hypothetical protein HA327_07200 [Candidatus Poseidoniaceae archaeon]|nr:MAG TPA: hypothetical protein D7H81_07135 [Candidatus Poseidoniales archaeon]HII45809.1 hypothetical protein [Candidatus Poseidoniaceae archaeon]
MPIVEDHNQTSDAELSARFNQHFSLGGSSKLVDAEGNMWYLSQDRELANFVALFEANIGLPMGRVFHNSAADSLELILESVDGKNFGFFAKRNRLKYLQSLWEVYGWGDFNIKQNSITTEVFPAVISGFYLSILEQYFGKRTKIQWRQLQDNLIICDVSDLETSLTKPPPLPNMPWATTEQHNDSVYAREIERRSIGWGIDGKISYVLPCDLINRIIYNAGGYTDTYNKSLGQYWRLNGIDNRYVTSTVCILQSLKQLFMTSDIYVFISETNNWSKIIDSHLKPTGLGSIKHVNSSGNVDEFSVEINQTAILTIGKLAGLWERANGKQSICSVDLTSTEFKVRFESLLSYN